MKVGDVSPLVLRATGVVLGVALGLAGTWLAGALPRRYEIEHVPSDRTRRRRNVAVVGLSVATSAWAGWYVTAFPEASMALAGPWLATTVVLCSAVITAAAIDLEHMILPHEITWGGAGLALLTSHFRGLGIVSSVVGALVGLALTYLPFLLYKKLRGRSGMGLGDANLAVLAGAWLGPGGVVFVIFAGAIQSALSAVFMRVAGISYGIPESVQEQLAALRKAADEGDEEARAALADDPMAADLGKEGEEATGARAVLGMRLPMGPFLVLACLEFLVARRWILDAFDSVFGR